MPLNARIRLPEPDELLDAHGLADLLGLDVRTVRNRAARGEVPASVLLGKRRLYTGDAVRKWLLGAAGTGGERPCPDCGRKCRGPGGLATHARLAHGVDTTP